ASEQPARVIGRNGQHAVHAAVPEVGERGTGIRVVDDVEHLIARGHRACELPDFHRRYAVILIDDRHLEVLDVAAEGVTQHDQLNDRKDHRHHDDHRAAPKAPHLAFDDGKCSLHGYCRLIMKGLSLADASWSPSRSARPVKCTKTSSSVVLWTES